MEKYAITMDTSGYTNIMEITADFTVDNFEEILNKQNQTSTVKNGVYEIFAGSWQEAKARAQAIAFNQDKELVGYTPGNNYTHGGHFTIINGQDAVDTFEKLKTAPHMNQLSENRLEEDYQDADTGIRVKNGYLLQ